MKDWRDNRRSLPSMQTRPAVQCKGTRWDITSSATQGGVSMILIGTAGYSYEDWKGPVYPETIGKGDMLSFYAAEFPFTEVNSSFYRIPNRFMFYHMSRKTPPDFTFVVKAHRSMTHSEKQHPELIDQFKDSLCPLQEASKLECILLQFPWSFKCSQDSVRHLEYLHEQLTGIPVAVEFRHRSWINDRTFYLLEKMGMAFVCVDEPQFASLVPPVCRKTAPFAYVRFHGRNYSKWWHHEQAYQRYDYLYTEDELKEWLPRLQNLAQHTRRVLVSMNNHYQGKSVINARMLYQLIENYQL